MTEFQKALLNLQDAVSAAIKNNIDLRKIPSSEKSLYDFNEKQKKYYYSNLKSKLNFVLHSRIDLHKFIEYDFKNKPITNQISDLLNQLETDNIKKLDKIVKELVELTQKLNAPKPSSKASFDVPKSLPQEIYSDIKADIDELSKCFDSGCFRSSIILCGRLLETSLHRKYYEATGKDLLEKSPGIGLGNVISKLKDENIALDPAITNQIHLINQVRIFSVHKKKEAFYPSKEQTHAIVLYTLDILGKLFV